MRLPVPGAGSAKECFEENHPGGGHQQGIGQDHDQRHRPANGAHFNQTCVLEFLGDKAEKRRQPRIGESRQSHGNAGERHKREQPAKPADVSSTGRMINGTHGHE